MSASTQHGIEIVAWFLSPLVLFIIVAFFTDWLDGCDL